MQNQRSNIITRQAYASSVWTRDAIVLTIYLNEAGFLLFRVWMMMTHQHVQVMWHQMRFLLSDTVGQVNVLGIGYMGIDGIVYRGERAHAVAQVTELTAQWPMSRSPSHTSPSQATHGRRSRSECCTAHRISRQVTGQPRVCNGNMASKTPSVQLSHARWLATTDGAHSINHITNNKTTLLVAQQIFANFITTVISSLYYTTGILFK